MNKKSILIGITGLVAGILLTGIIAFVAMPSLMMLEDVSPYDFEKTVEVFEQSVADQGWKGLYFKNELRVNGNCKC